MLAEPNYKYDDTKAYDCCHCLVSVLADVSAVAGQSECPEAPEWRWITVGPSAMVPGGEIRSNNDDAMIVLTRVEEVEFGRVEFSFSATSCSLFCTSLADVC